MYLTPFPPMDALGITANLAPMGSWYFGNAKRELRSSSMLDRIYRNRLTRYLKDRDKQRYDRAKLPPKWQDFNLPLAAKFWGIATSPCLRFLKNKLKFDKHFHPGNLSKGIKDPAKAELAAECPFCLFPDSPSHWSVQCSSIPRSV